MSTGLQLSVSRARLDAVRRLMLGKELYQRCSRGDKVSEQDLVQQMQVLREQGCLEDCDLPSMVRLCELRVEDVPSSQAERRKLVPRCMQDNTPSKVKCMLSSGQYDDVGTILTECATDSP